MFAQVNKAKKEAAEEILQGDFSKDGFFLKVGEDSLPESEQQEIVAKRATEFLNK